MNEQREEIARAMTSDFSRKVWDGKFNPSPDSEYNKAVRDHVRSDYLNDADLVIAHLWQAADDPEVVEEVAKSITSIWNKPSPNPTAFVASAETLARAASIATLTALLGPNPNEQEAE